MTPPEIRHAHAETNGVRLHYAATGDPDDRLLLFLHGFPEFWYAWRRQLRFFGDGYLAVAPDQRGYNRSSKPAEVEAYRIEILVGDVVALADRFGKERFVVVGHDWGGMVAWSLALARPERLEKLVVVNAPHPAIFRRELATNPEQRKASEYMSAFQYSEAEEALEADDFAALDSILVEGIEQGYFTEEDREAYLEAWSRPGALTGMLHWYRAAGVHPGAVEPTGHEPGDGEEWIVRVPTLVLWGEQDRYLLPGNLEGLEEYVPDLELRRVPDAGHWIVHQKPDLVNEAIREFLAR